MEIHTIGHSTRTVETLVELLRQNGVEEVVDVRSVPRSRYNPQFNSDALRHSLAAAGLAYRHMPGLGGLRKPRIDSPNDGWESEGFRGYADYMQTSEFEAQLTELITLAQTKRLSLMCAEALPSQCHRSLIADALSVRKVTVQHILDAERRQPHALTPWVVREGTRLRYPFTLQAG